ncbi:hypothetical protein C0J52_26179 [Blattella germanica]|nr:hypothetical protein C0J52_26179 [Blattella germanica]
MASYREEEDPFEEDIVFDQAGLLTNTTKMNTAIRRVSSGKCALFAKTLGLCGAFFGLGLCIAIPTFLSPIAELQADISPISSIYVARTSGYLIGSIIGGFLFDYFNRLFLLFISLLLTAVFITVTPWCQVLWLLQACMVFLGMTMGFLDTGGNVLCLDLWGRNSGPFMQALHFSFGLGAFVAPLLASPFLEASNMDVLPTIIPTTANSFENTDPRGKRAAALNETLSVILSDQPHIWFNSTPKSIEVFSMTSDHPSSYIDISTDPSVLKLESNSTNRLEINFTTVKSISTTQIPKQKKPKKTDAAKLGSTNCETCHLKTPLKEPITTATSLLSSLKTDSNKQENSDYVTIPNSEMEITAINTTNLNTDHIQVYKKLQQIDAVPPLTKASGLNVDGDTSTPENNIHLTPVTSTTATSYSTGDYSTSETLPNSLMLKMPENNISTSINKKVDTKNSIHKDNDTSTYARVNDTKDESRNYNITLSKSENSDSKKMSIENEKKNTEKKEKHASIITVATTEINANGATSTPQSKIVEPLGTLGERPNYTDSSILVKSVVKENNRPSTESSEIPLSPQKSFMTTEHVNSDEMYEVRGPTTISNVQSSIEKNITSKHHKPHSTDNNIDNVRSSPFDKIANKIEKYGFSKVQFMYLMVGLFIFAISLVFLGFLCHNPRDPKSKQEEDQGAKKFSNKALHGLLIGLMAVFFLLYVGLEVTYGQLVLAFAVHGDLQLAPSTGLVIAVVFWGAFAAMRFASIFFASGFGPVTMLLLNFVFCTLGTVLLSSMANQTETALWVGTALLGIGLASIFPTGILWIERYIHVSNKVAAAFVMGASLGEMVCPVTVYHLMIANPAMLMYSAVVINILCILTFIALRCLAVRYGEKYCAVSNNGYQLANQDEEEDMIDMSPSGSMIALRRHSFSSEHRALLNGNPHRGP